MGYGCRSIKSCVIHVIRLCVGVSEGCGECVIINAVYKAKINKKQRTKGWLQ